jgi:hypothetical protein
VRAREVLAKIEDSPERQDALRLLADTLDLPRETLARLGARASGPGRVPVEDLSPEMLAKGEQLERRVLAACVRHPPLVGLLAEVPADHFDSELHRRFRSLLVEGGEEDESLVALRAELDARAAREALDERTGKELLLNLRARRLRRELAGAELERVKELQSQLARVKEAVAELA